MTALTQARIEEIKTAPEDVPREVADFLAFLKSRPSSSLLSGGEPDAERAEWLRLASQDLARAYCADEPEYPDSCLKEPNAHYAGR